MRGVDSVDGREKISRAIILSSRRGQDQVYKVRDGPFLTEGMLLQKQGRKQRYLTQVQGGGECRCEISWSFSLDCLYFLSKMRMRTKEELFDI